MFKNAVGEMALRAPGEQWPHQHRRWTGTVNVDHLAATEHTHHSAGWDNCCAQTHAVSQRQKPRIVDGGNLRTCIDNKPIAAEGSATATRQRCGLQNLHFVTRLLQPEGRCETRKAGTNDNDHRAAALASDATLASVELRARRRFARAMAAPNSVPT